MIILKSLEIKGFMAVKHTRIVFPKCGSMFIAGRNEDDAFTPRNGSGKTTIINALCYAIYGRTVSSIPKQYLEPTNGLRAGYVRARFIDGERDFEITRYTSKSTATVRVNGTQIKIHSDGIGSFINLDFKTFCNIHVLSQQDSFVFESKGERLKLFERFTGLDLIIESYKKRAKNLSVEYTSQFNKALGRLEALMAEFKDLKKNLKAFHGADIDGMKQKRKVIHDIKRSIASKRLLVHAMADEFSSVNNNLANEARGRLTTQRTCSQTLSYDAKVHWDNLKLIDKDIRKVRAGLCEACGARLPKDRIDSELSRLYAMKTKTEAARDSNVRSMADCDKQITQLKKELELLLRQKDQMQDQFDILYGKLYNIEQFYVKRLGDIDNRLAVFNDRVESTMSSLTDVKAEIVKNRKIRNTNRKLIETAKTVGVFINTDLRQLLLKNYLENFNNDLNITLGLFSGFTGGFTDDFDIILRGLPFSSASTGEKVRFVLATYINLFRYVATNKNRFNFLFFDDFDLGLDEGGVEALIEVFKLLGNSMLCVVLSQNNAFQDRLPNSLVAIKRGGVSTYKLTKKNGVYL